VELTSISDPDPLKSHVKGMTVYNTKPVGTDLSTGMYYNDGTKWVHIGSSLDEEIGNEVTGATDNGGLATEGSGTTIDPYTLKIADNGVTTAKIADGAVTAEKLHAMEATEGQILTYVDGRWIPKTYAAIPRSCDGGVIVEAGRWERSTADVTFPTKGRWEDLMDSGYFSFKGSVCLGPRLGNMSWSSAVSTCNTYNGGGVGGWRLPNVMEVVYLMRDPFAYGEYNGILWSITENSSNAYVVNCLQVYYTSYAKVGEFSVRCMRNL
jgi:hypothetical protein